MKKLLKSLKNSWNGVLFLVIPLLLICTASHSITLDQLTELQEGFANGTTTTSNTTVTTASAIGGKRQLFVQNISSPVLVNRVEARIELGYLVYSEDSNVRGAAVMTYNGPITNTTSLTPGLYIPSNPTGLGGMDITKDGSTKFVLRVIGFDYPSNTPVPITFRVFDASDSSGNKRSEMIYNLNQAVAPGNPLTVEFPFASFVAGPGGAASFTNVGAIQIIINSVSKDNDLTFDLINTDGTCPTVPQVGVPIVDDCGDCNGTNQRMDDCGVCQLGVCQPNPVDPNCNKTCLDCLGVPNGTTLPGDDCDSGNVGICKNGKWQGNPLIGPCTCTPNETPKPEICFDNKDNNCNGAIDENNASCIDCAGVPGGKAKPDRCGVCNGNGQSCLGCNSFNQENTLRRLDGGAKRQERAIKAVADILLASSGISKTQKTEISKLLVRAHDFQLRNWELSWTLPKVSTTCSNTQFCVTTSNVSILTEYRERNDELYKMFLTVNRMLRKLRKGQLRSTEKKYQKLAKQYRKENFELSNTVPETQYSCT